MLFHSTIRKELARSFGATLVGLVTIVLTMGLIRTLGQAAKGSVNPSDVMLIMGYSVLGILPIILNLSLFIAMVMTLSRMYRDSEMVIWFTGGRGLAGFLGPMFRFAWPVLIAILALSLLAWPWTNQKNRELRDRFEKRGDLERVAPGQFQESASGQRVFFIDKDSPDGKVGKSVFISTAERGKETVTIATQGRMEVVNGERYLLLTHGQRLENSAGQSDYRISEFSEYRTRLSGDAADPSAETPMNTWSTWDLLQHRGKEQLAELGWRLGLALAAFNFVIVAAAMSNVNPRGGRAIGTTVSFLTFFIYYQLILLGQTWVNNGKIGFAAQMLGLHGGALLLALLWLAKRHRNWTLASALKAWLERAGKAQAA